MEKVVTKFRTWQRAASNVTQHMLTKSGVVVPVNACVGSGKTAVACNAFGQFITASKDKKTIQMFVTPRIRLCDQQNNEIKEFLEGAYGLRDKVDYSLVPVDCTKDAFNKKSMSLHAKHAIFIICSESLLGVDSSLPGKPSRWHKWLSRFKKWQEEDGFTFGWAVYDEAHNYETQRDTIVADEKSAAQFFKVMLLSGTPSAFQRELSSKFKDNVCSCSPREAMENGWICKPTLNIVQGGQESWARAIVAVLNREIAICQREVFKPRIMVNCSGIDDIKQLSGLSFFKENAGKKFHFVSLHSLKAYEDDNIKRVVQPTVDGRDVDADEAYNAIDHIDDGTYFKDDLPVIVAQVQMLGEGINVSSFNACLTASNSEKTAMQQIGRIVRNFEIDGKTKVKDGHANVYAIFDNSDSLCRLLLNLQEYDLTEECFQWGDKIDISTSSGADDGDSDELVGLHDTEWEPIDVNNDIDIVEVLQTVSNKAYKNATDAMYAEWLEGDSDSDGKNDAEELEDLVEQLSSRGMLSLYSSHGFSKSEARSARKAAVSVLKEAKKAGVKPADALKKAKKEVKKNPAFDVFMSWMFALRHALKSSETNRKLWSIDKRSCIEYILKSESVAEFLAKHLSKKMESRLVK